MARSVKPIPDGFRSITPYLAVDDADSLIQFLKKAFGAKEVQRATRPDGTVSYAVVRVGDSMVEVADARPPWEPMRAAVHLYVSDTDHVYDKALRAGAVSLSAPSDLFYGERGATVRDPCGNHWHISTRIELLTPEELERRQAAYYRQHAH
ncbi:MAG TPA: VOC family protein [Candidatus Limnocylindrales bacterium]|nr:VOC family protein [Candidatus Limnocylindrales bacterium]